ncbi:palmitoyltransferase protein [Dioscorea alata]|uniref:Palmitoyltransferase protein n=1 Tax=Dioscorea alata TaxID=55571 RepID=A0ACB7V842_DIOAL|nr:palmitoyltransferase protein [Dioscorea alata]
MAEKKHRLVSVPLLAVICSMLYVYCSTVFIFLDEWLGLATASGILNAIIFSWVAFMTFFSFFVSVLTDPGSVPPFFAPAVEDARHDSGDAVYCEKCCSYKPPRTHHCRVCKRCVLKMDHHCIWINTCVGYKNYKSFVIFALHASLGSCYAMVIFVSNLMQKEHDFGIVSVKLFYALSGLVILGASLSSTSLFCWHVYLLAHNMTTIEYRGAQKDRWLANKSGQKYRHPFDLGFFQNLILIFGPNMLKWFCPTAVGHLGDGTQFPISND